MLYGVHLYCTQKPCIWSRSVVADRDRRQAFGDVEARILLLRESVYNEMSKPFRLSSQGIKHPRNSRAHATETRSVGSRPPKSFKRRFCPARSHVDVLLLRLSHSHVRSDSGSLPSTPPCRTVRHAPKQETWRCAWQCGAWRPGRC